MKRINEVTEEYGVTVIYVDKTYISLKCPVHGEDCRRRTKQGLFKYTKLDNAFNSDLVGAYNMLITPSSERSRGDGLKTRPGVNP